MKFLSALLLLAASAFAQSHTVKVWGPQTAFAGDTIYLRAQAASETPKSLFLAATPPTGWSHTFICGLAMEGCFGTTRPYVWGGISPFVIRIKIPADAVVGANIVPLSFEMGGVTVTQDWTVTVAPKPGDPRVVPPLDTTKWRSNMLTLAAKWCQPTQILGFGVETQVWYYDGARVYFQIADYTKDVKWNDCGLWIAKQYRDYVLLNKGSLPGYRLFADGLERAYHLTGDESFKNAVLMMAKSAPYSGTGGEVSDSRIRETAYILNVYLAAERLGAGRHPQTERAVSQLMGHFSMIFDTATFSIHQTFFDGLAAESLIGWYEMSGDTRVPPVIKKMLDWHWNVGWTGSKLVYNPEPLGPRCDNTCQRYTSELIALSMPAFGWYARVSGDTSYRDKGDVMWSHMLDTPIAYSAENIFAELQMDARLFGLALRV